MRGWPNGGFGNRKPCEKSSDQVQRVMDCCNRHCIGEDRDQPCSDHLKNESAKTPVRVTALVRAALPRSLFTTSLRSDLHCGNGSKVPPARRTRCLFNRQRFIIMPMKATIDAIASALLVMLGSPAPLFAQAPAQQQQPEFVQQGQQLMRDGKAEEALALYRQTLLTSPNSVPANVAAGSVLDLMGKGEEARKYFTKAIDVADTPEGKASAKRAMAMSYAFEGNCKKTIEYEQQVFDFHGSVKNFFQQGEIANEAARVCIDSGDLDTAYKWYQIGHDTGLKEPDIKP